VSLVAGMVSRTTTAGARHCAQSQSCDGVFQPSDTLVNGQRTRVYCHSIGGATFVSFESQADSVQVNCGRLHMLRNSHTTAYSVCIKIIILLFHNFIMIYVSYEQ